MEAEHRSWIEQRLAQERAQLRRLVERLALRDEETARIVAGSDDGSAGSLCDLAQVAALYEMDAMITRVLRDRIERVERAYALLATGRYGTCEECGAEIDRDRLAAVPDATLCIDCQRRRERRARAARLRTPPATPAHFDAG